MKKRKDIELLHFHHDFPSILPSNSSRKFRRLDAELCTIMEEEEEEEEESNVMMVHDHDPAPGHVAVSSSEDRAIVLYDPTNTPLLKSPSSPELSIVIKADLVPGLKDYLSTWGFQKLDNSYKNEMRREKSFEASKDCMAVVPWVAHNSPMPGEEIVPETDSLLGVEECEMMETDEPYANNNDSENAMEIGEKVEAVGSASPWQQPHCMMLNVLQNASTPIRWC